jgi:hypothetical protein
VISGTYQHVLDVSGIILRAYQLAGLMGVEQDASGPTWNRKFSFARDFLQQILDTLGTEGIFARAVSLELVEMVAGQYIYDLPATVYDVIGDGSYIDADEDVDAATGETVVKQMDREAWQRLASKAAESQPTLFWANRQADPTQVYVWPTPSESGGSIRFQCHRLLADVSPGTVTVDLERFWIQYLQFRLAYLLAVSHSQPENRCGLLAGEANQLLQRCKGTANQNTPNMAYNNHSTGWN